MGKRSEGPKGCLLYSESLESLSFLSDAEAGRVIKAVAAYFLTGEAPGELGQTAEKIVCRALCNNVDRSLERYRETCERNRANRNKYRLAPGEVYVLPDREED